MTIAVVDGMGGGVGKAIVEALARRCPDAEIWALGTNALATAAMKKAGAHMAATGENAICVSCRRADIVAGSLGIVLAESMMTRASCLRRSIISLYNDLAARAIHILCHPANKMMNAFWSAA